MVSTQEIIERSFYMRLLSVALKNNLTLDPANYLPATRQSLARFEADKKAMEKFIYIFGTGNNQVKGPKEVPRIVLNLQSYYPGHIGVERYMIDDEDKENPQVWETSYTSRDLSIDVHLVANNQDDLRLLHNIMYKALPSVGYIAPYISGTTQEYMATKISSTNNIFIEVGNYYDHQDLDHGLLEKVYQYTATDGILPVDGSGIDVVPIKTIDLIISNRDEIDDKAIPFVDTELIVTNSDDHSGFSDKNGVQFRDKDYIPLYGN